MYCSIYKSILYFHTPRYRARNKPSVNHDYTSLYTAELTSVASAQALEIELPTIERNQRRARGGYLVNPRLKLTVLRPWVTVSASAVIIATSAR